ncbi:MAG TPA: hypothetical protein VFW11_02985 [Cyclobacteriaceae bacterium]|nr:hypothetical protein [Cyclobacteriaceae bacterium]
MSSCCSGTSFIELDAFPHIGKATQLMGQDLKNVIQVSGYLDEGEIYLNLRPFDQEEDRSLIPSPHCYCLITVEMDVPMWVATAFSPSACPMEIQ